MNAEDKFECKHQELHDGHTGVTLTLGTHAGSGHHWLRIAVPHAAGPTGESVETKTSTVTFGPDGQALKILPHVAVPDGSTSTPESTDVESPRAHEIKEELHHLDEIERELPFGTAGHRQEPGLTMQAGHDTTAKVDKHAKHGKK